MCLPESDGEQRGGHLNGAAGWCRRTWSGSHSISKWRVLFPSRWCICAPACANRCTLHLVGLLGPGGGTPWTPSPGLRRARHPAQVNPSHPWLPRGRDSPRHWRRVVRTLLIDMRRLPEPGGHCDAHRTVLRHGSRPPLERTHWPTKPWSMAAAHTVEHPSGHGGAGGIPAGR